MKDVFQRKGSGQQCSNYILSINESRKMRTDNPPPSPFYLTAWEHCDLGKDDFGGMLGVEAIRSWFKREWEEMNQSQKLWTMEVWVLKKLNFFSSFIET